ncbi:MAG: hypothetical protein Q4D42_02950 [Eubacteriales bacterium]|nr:hypothetical protein [Eubacteriales bacterium]
MDYTQRKPTKEETIAQALRSCNDRNCDACPYGYGYPSCRNLLHEAADMIENLEKQVRKNG